jgi:hypothetical protein
MADEGVLNYMERALGFPSDVLVSDLGAVVAEHYY